MPGYGRSNDVRKPVCDGAILLPATREEDRCTELYVRNLPDFVLQGFR